MLTPPITAKEGGQIPELKDFSKHITRFGAGGVMDAARDAGLPIKELTQLLEQIDALTPHIKHRKSAEARVRTWLGLDEKKEA